MLHVLFIEQEHEENEEIMVRKAVLNFEKK